MRHRAKLIRLIHRKPVEPEAEVPEKILQKMHVSANNHSLVNSHSMQRAASMPPAVPIPWDPSAMDVDINAVASRHPFPPLPTGVSFRSFVKFCHNRKLCHRCLKAYNSTHKGPDGKGIGCPNLPPRTTQEIELFMQKHQSQVSTPSNSQTPVFVQRPSELLLVVLQ
ncbi:uncharacterized protein MELLADRAFT_110756 [Melampsora larici-populina 98AG31]|uniref:Uncharacterized protein n=1 Tax=Melampsora larici-populina (strain 98AG31 / pathotype 3-4-7) TaxID=747676 RepID=F4S0U8_MELLP|nr:uncharacterized protein MELLADRAFT_110756 [Melampsora larici-populina 98AG31]EGG01747.1 hypothetical protein MELLADRAFT_110756 [Melampsora larici-populina 98AG31]